MQILPSSEGKIEEVLLAFPYSFDATNTTDLLHYFQGIIQGLPVYTKVYILGRFGIEDLFQLNLKNEDDEVGHIVASRNVKELDAQFPVPDEVNKYYRKWVQDPFVMLQESQNIVLVEPCNFPDPGSRYIAEHFCIKTNQRKQHSDLYFEGGNILGGRGYAIVGPDTIEQNRLKLFPDLPPDRGRQKIKDQFKNVLGVERVISSFLNAPHSLPKSYHGGGSGYQALYHLDLYMMPAGKLKKTGEEEIFIAKIDDFRQEKLGPLTPEIRTLQAALDETSSYFENYHKERHGFKFKVTRIPLLVCFANGIPYYQTWNNCLLEIHRDGKNAYLPKYHSGDSDMRDSSSVEHTVRSLFEMKGFSVHWVDQEFDRYAKSYGSLHCMVKVIKRSQS